jgi:hypothetical protein
LEISGSRYMIFWRAAPRRGVRRSWTVSFTGFSHDSARACSQEYAAHLNSPLSLRSIFL